MRFNLGCGSDIRHGYVNVDKMPQGNMSLDVYRQGDMQSLDWLTEDNMIEEIIALDCLEYIPNNAIVSTIGNWTKKLTDDGILKILVPDCHLVAKSFYHGQLNLKEYSQITFGKREDGDIRLTMIDALSLVDIIEDAGLKIILKRYEGIAIYVEATK